MSDEDLMLAYKNGDLEAFNVLYEKYSPKVYAFAKRRLQANEVDDFYQNFWRHLHEKRHLYSSQPFLFWFYALIKNLLVDEYRSRQRKKKLLENLPVTTLSHEVLESMDELLKSLPQSSEILIRKHYLEGHSYEDLEKELGMSQTSLRKRLSRVMAQLKSLGGLK